MSKASDPVTIVAEATPLKEGASQSKGWKSGLCSCCRYGLFHPALLNAVFLPPILMGQMLTRMKLTWAGTPSSQLEEYKNTFKTVIGIAIAQWAIYAFFYCPLETFEETDDDKIGLKAVPNDDCPLWKNLLATWTQYIFGVYVFIVMVRLRYAIRAKYNIPEQNCIGCEDCCCIFFCGCLSSVQMAHQTTDYDLIRATCLTSNGLPPGVDSDGTLVQAIVV
jgi:Cys-rich protein (TIGR01571 family)